MATYAQPEAHARRRDRARPHPPPLRHDPIWAKLLLIMGSLVMVISGAAVVVPRLLANWALGDIPQQELIPQELRGENIDGAINLLLLGMDERAGNTTEPIRADTIIIVHIPSTHDAVFMISLPRDAEVPIPDFPETNFKGWRTKINAAFAFGARTPEGRPDNSEAGRRRGAALTMMTIGQLVPGLKFNGAAIINFAGFRSVLKAIGGVTLCVDHETRSVHYNKQDQYVPGEVKDVSQQKVYKVGCYHMEYWEALDFVRQRKSLPDGDYGRQRHQQQLLKAIFKKVASAGTLTNPSAISDLRSAAGELLTLDLGGTDVLDWAFTLKGLSSDSVVMIKTNGGKLDSTGVAPGNQRLNEDTMKLLAAVRDDTVYEFLLEHPTWIATDK